MATVEVENEEVENGEVENGEVEMTEVDLTNEKEVVNLFKFAHNKFGSVDVLINNAGISGNRFKLADMEMKEFKRVIDINLIGSFICAREAVRCMGYSYGGNGGSIVNISSTAAQTGGYHLSHYAASKSAILSMTLSLSHECAIEGIRVNSVSPGVIATDQNNCVSQSKIQQTIPLQRIGQPIDVANTIAWLVSDQASYITGIDIPVAGGK